MPKFWKVKVAPLEESWEDTGRTLFIPVSEAATAAAALCEMSALLRRDWRFVSVTPYLEED